MGKPTLKPYEEWTRIELKPGEVPRPTGTYRSFATATNKAAKKAMSVEVKAGWFVGLGWFYVVEVWDLIDVELLLTRDLPLAEANRHWRGATAFWDCVAAGEAHARKLAALRDLPFPEKMPPYCRCDEGYRYHKNKGEG